MNNHLLPQRQQQVSNISILRNLEQLDEQQHTREPDTPFPGPALSSHRSSEDQSSPPTESPPQATTPVNSSLGSSGLPTTFSAEHTPCRSAEEAV